ncbi:uncharacterized protein [Physcomitrium patens]|uniref:uncharacterized protein n=1 Tax=Physcomitrium patens TaxID=3218 RepID=UPI0001622A3D
MNAVKWLTSCHKEGTEEEEEEVESRRGTSRDEYGALNSNSTGSFLHSRVHLVAIVWATQDTSDTSGGAVPEVASPQLRKRWLRCALQQSVQGKSADGPRDRALAWSILSRGWTWTICGQILGPNGMRAKFIESMITAQGVETECIPIVCRASSRLQG